MTRKPELTPEVEACLADLCGKHGTNPLGTLDEIRKADGFHPNHMPQYRADMAERRAGNRVVAFTVLAAFVVACTAAYFALAAYFGGAA